MSWFGLSLDKVHLLMAPVAVALSLWAVISLLAASKRRRPSMSDKVPRKPSESISPPTLKHTWLETAGDNNLPIIPWRCSISLDPRDTFIQSSSVDGRKGSTCTPWSESGGTEEGCRFCNVLWEDPELLGVGEQFLAESGLGRREGRQLSLSA